MSRAQTARNDRVTLGGSQPFRKQVISEQRSSRATELRQRLVFRVLSFVVVGCIVVRRVL